MGVIANQLKLDNARATYTALGEEVFAGNRVGFAQSFTRTVPVDGTALEIDAMGATPAVQEIVGSRRFASLRAYANRGRVKRWGPDALNIPILQILNDKNDLIAQQLAAYVRDSASYFDKPAFDFLLSNPTCIDGGALLSSSHSFGAAGGTWSNLGSALTPSTFFTGFAAMEALRLENGEPAGYLPRTFFVGPDLRKVATDLVTNDRVYPIAAGGVEAYSSDVAATTKSNWLIEGGTPLQVIVAPRITGSGYSNSWFLIDTSKEMARPVVIGEAISPQTYSVVDPSSFAMVDRSEAIFYAEGQAAFVGAVPLSIYGYIG